MEFPLVQPFQVHTPSSMLVVGPSGCGKTVFTQKLLENNLDLFETYPQSTHYCYGAWQPKFKEMKFAQFHEGIPELEDLDAWFPKGQGILVLDDLMDEGSHDKRVLDLFTKHSHHRDITVLYLCQDMFPTGKYAKSISRNAHYVIAFKNPRDQLGVRNLLLQSFPTCWKECLETYQTCTQEPFGYMWLDLHPASGDDERVLSHVLKDQGWTRSYQKGQGLGTPWTVAKKAEWVTRKLIPSTRHVFDRFWSGDITKSAFAGKAGIFTKKFWTRPKKGTRIRLVKNPKTGKYENIYEEP